MDYLDTIFILLHLLQACIHVMCGYMINPMEQNIIKSSLYSSPGFMKYQTPFSWKKQFVPGAFHHPSYSYFSYPQQAMFTNHHYSYVPYPMMLGRNPRHYSNALQQYNSPHQPYSSPLQQSYTNQLQQPYSSPHQQSYSSPLQQPWYMQHQPPIYPTKQVIITHKPLRPTMAMFTASTKKIQKFYKMTPITHMTLPTLSSASTSKQPFTPAWLHANIRKALSPSMTYRAIERNYSILNTSTSSPLKIFREPAASVKVIKAIKEKVKAFDKEGQESKKYYNYITSNQELRHVKPTFMKEESVYGNHSWNTDSLYKVHEPNEFANYTTSDRTHFKDSDWRPLNVHQETDLVLLNGIHRKPVTFAEVVSHSPFTFSDVVTKSSSTTEFFDLFNDLTTEHPSSTERAVFYPKAKVRLMEPDFPEQIQKPLSLDDDFDYFDEPSSLIPTTSASTSTSTTTSTTTTPSTTTTKRTSTTTPSTTTTKYTTSTSSTTTQSTPTTREVKRGRGRHVQRRPQTVDVYDTPKSVTPAFKPMPTTSKRDIVTTPKSSFFSFFDIFLDHGEHTTIPPQKSLTTHRFGSSAFDLFTTTISPFVRSFGVPHTTTKESAFERIFGSTSPRTTTSRTTTSTRPSFSLTTRPALFFFPQNYKTFRNGSEQTMKHVNTQTVKPLKRKDGKKLMKKPRRRKTTTTSTTTTTSATTLDNTKKYLNKYSKRFRNMTMNLNFMKNKPTTTPSTTTTTSTSTPPTGTYDETTFSFDKMTTTIGGTFLFETMIPTSGIPRRSVNPSTSTTTTTTTTTTTERAPQRMRGSRKGPSSPSPNRRVRPTDQPNKSTTSTQAPMFQLKPRNSRRKLSSQTDTSSTTSMTVSLNSSRDRDLSFSRDSVRDRDFNSSRESVRESVRDRDLNSVRDRDIRKVEKKFETSIMKIAHGQRKTRTQARRKIDEVKPKMYRNAEASNEVSHLPIEAFFPDVV